MHRKFQMVLQGLHSSQPPTLSRGLTLLLLLLLLSIFKLGSGQERQTSDLAPRTTPQTGQQGCARCTPWHQQLGHVLRDRFSEQKPDSWESKEVSLPSLCSTIPGCNYVVSSLISLILSSQYCSTASPMRDTRGLRPLLFSIYISCWSHLISLL